MNRKNLVLALSAIILVAGSIGYAVSQVLVQRSLTASVTVSASAGLTLLDGEGTPITTLDYGVIPLDEWVGLTITIQNTGNVPLSLTCARLDTATSISTNFAHLDGSWFQPSVPKPLGVGESIMVVVEVRASWDALGDYSLEFTFTGS